MLVVISDLHLVDGTAGDHNVKGEAFRIWIDAILDLARSQRATEIVLLYLGDIVDLVRTEQWLGAPPEDRPWGSPGLISDPRGLTPGCRAMARKVLRDIAAVAGGPLDVLSGRAPGLQDRFDALGIDVRRIFLPGNHDRLYGVDPGIKEDLDALLGVDPRGIDGLSAHRLESRRYGVLARHGHEYDLWNFEGWAPDRFEFSDEDFLRVPIGDVLACELLSRLPSRVRDRLLAAGVSEVVALGVYRRLQDVENVRPLAAAIPWIYAESMRIRECGPPSWSTELRERIATAIEEGVAEVYDMFMELPFVREWMRAHDRWNDPFDEANKLEALHMLLRRGVSLDTMRFFMVAIEKLGFTIEGPQRLAAQREPLCADDRSGLHYVVYGHTHHFEQVALRTAADHEKVYFNAGTWRTRCMRAAEGHDFVSWKVMSYLVFYNEDEDPIGRDKKGVSFETWSGSTLKRAR